MIFEREDNKTIMSGHVVRYKTGHRRDHEISASRDAVMIQGSFTMTSEHSVNDFCRQLKLAFHQYKRLKYHGHHPLNEEEEKEILDTYKE